MGLGADRVRLSFNPGGNKAVEDLKKLAADFIDACDRMKADGKADGETARLWALAMTHAEDAAMWAVKAVTACFLLAIMLAFQPAVAANLAPPAPVYKADTPSWAGWIVGVGVAGQWDTVNLPGVLNGGVASAKPSSVQIEGVSLLNYEFANRWVLIHKLAVGYSNPSIFGADVQEWRIKTGPGVGYDFGPALFYFSGGAAAQANTFLGFRNPLVGFYVGPGLEFKPFGNDVVVGLDVNYVDMSGANPFGSNSNTSVELGAHLAYHFH